ncbi:type I methionyl aminopeptidase [Candidatus Nomurabacteria bacterium]|nr:type I methionyl aminopeptidase [Candidatus Nomurabacteria bacterium]
MITIKTPQEIMTLKEGGKHLAFVLSLLTKEVKPGVSTSYLNDVAIREIGKLGDKPAFLNYTPYGAKRPYPAAICISVNDEIIHGIPNENSKILKEGDIVSLDLGIVHNGLITDSAVTVPVGKVDESAKKLLKVTSAALLAGIKAAKGGGFVGDIGAEIEKHAKKAGFGIAEELCGHGVGYSVHEDPYVPNFGKKGQGPKLKPGMVIAIEPMFNEGTGKTKIDKDGYTFRTADGKRSAHFEHTIVITDGKPEILTVI